MKPDEARQWLETDADGDPPGVRTHRCAKCGAEIEYGADEPFGQLLRRMADHVTDEHLPGEGPP